MSPVIAFAVRHDHDPAFQAAFIVLTFIAAALLNVGAFLALVAIHVVLDIVKYHTVHGRGWTWTMKATLRESLVDIVLLTMALFVSVYFHESAGLIAVSSMVRYDGVLLVGIATVLARMEVFCHVLRVFAHVRKHIQNVHKGIAGAWSRTERFALIGTAACLLMIVAAPMLSHDPDAVFRILTRELLPWYV
jgi:hypothetical protein